MTRPSLRGCVDALLTTDPRFGWVQPTDEEADAAETIRWVDDTHQGTADDPDDPSARLVDQHWGLCRECGELWPCATWAWAQHLAVQFLGRAADRVVAGRCAAVHPFDDSSTCGRATGHPGLHGAGDVEDWAPAGPAD